MGLCLMLLRLFSIGTNDVIIQNSMRLFSSNYIVCECVIVCGRPRERFCTTSVEREGLGRRTATPPREIGQKPAVCIVGALGRSVGLTNDG